MSLCGQTPEQVLLKCAKNGETMIVSHLLRMDVDVAAIDKHGKTALLRAAKYGHCEICKILIVEGKADVFAVTHDKRNAVHLAAAAGHDAVVKLLLSMPGATRLLDGTDSYGRKPMQVIPRTLSSMKRQAIKDAFQVAEPPAADVNCVNAHASSMRLGPSVEPTIDEVKAQVYVQVTQMRPSVDDAKSRASQQLPSAAYVADLRALIDMSEQLSRTAASVRINRRKCQHVAARLEAFRPGLLHVMEKLEVNGPKAVEDIGNVFVRLLAAMHDVFQEALSVVSGWQDCNKGDFGALVRSLLAGQFNLDFVTLHCNTTDLKEQIEPVLRILKIDASGTRKDWDALFDEADVIDRKLLLSDALDIIRVNPDAAANVNRLLREYSLSTSDVLAAFLSQGIEQSIQLEEFNILVDSMGGKEKPSQEARSPSARRYPVHSKSDSLSDLADAPKNDADKC